MARRGTALCGLWAPLPLPDPGAALSVRKHVSTFEMQLVHVGTRNGAVHSPQDGLRKPRKPMPPPHVLHLSKHQNQLSNDPRPPSEEYAAKPGAEINIPYDRMIVDEFRRRFPRARWSDARKAWFVPGRTAALGRWMAENEAEADAHAMPRAVTPSTSILSTAFTSSAARPLSVSIRLIRGRGRRASGSLRSMGRRRPDMARHVPLIRRTPAPVARH